MFRPQSAIMIILITALFVISLIKLGAGTCTFKLATFQILTTE
jgi:hypothetical protein